jgi:pyridoxamine 5'-phosphate oxidase
MINKINMPGKLADLRKDYKLSTLNEQDLPKDPFHLMQNWVSQAIESQVEEPSAMILSTVGKEGRPSSRVVLLKGLENNGLVFYTNHLSRKGREIALHPSISLLFFWPQLERQLRVEGTASLINEEESDKYFASRPRMSQLGAWASPQSSAIPSREFLEKNFEQLEANWENKNISRPPNWGGYHVKPDYYEFWQGRPGRMHDRIEYKPDGKTWLIARLAP